MKTHSKNAFLTLVLTFAAAVLPGVVPAADHGAHGPSHAQTKASVEVRQIYTTTGIIKSVDKAVNKVMIEHEPVPALGWPNMTMGFIFEDASPLDGLKAGDKVRFDFCQQGNVYIIVDIEARP
ncbi:MAG: copper-binding protein [Candidatus Adiutrix sp.]|jgi:Cu(I)/Ag(I) efflux system protein CusF|nr:copper-binding protein [Candidatus Adiutrix sp.]